MTEDGTPKPAAPASPAPSDPVKDSQSSSSATATSEPATTTSSQASRTTNTSTPTGSDVPSSPPRPESSLIQTGEMQHGTSAMAEQQPQVPVLPARNYPRDPRWLTYGTLPATLPSRVLPRFFKVLAILIFLTSTSATLLTLIYQVSCSVSHSSNVEDELTEMIFKALHSTQASSHPRSISFPASTPNCSL